MYRTIGPGRPLGGESRGVGRDGGSPVTTITRMHSRKPFLKGLLLALGLWLLLVLVALLSFGVFPRTMTGWAVAFVLGPVLFLFFELVGELVGEVVRRLPGVRHVVDATESRNRRRSFSGDRVSTYLVISLACAIPLLALVMWASSRGHSPVSHPIRDWLQQNFHGW